MRSILLLPILLALAGCSLNSLPNWLKPYSVDVQQGNVVTQDAVDKLRVGMTRAQVRFVLGTPLLTDMFHADRWDYVYQDHKGGKLTEEKHFAVFFDKQELVSRWEGDVFPTRRPELTPLTPPVTPATATPTTVTPQP